MTGNLYINDKSTGYVVGQQLFGGPGLQVGGSQWAGLSGWDFKWMRLQVFGAPLDKLSVVVPSATANAAQTEI